MNYNPMRNLPADAGYKAGDVLVLCGELFGRGYANGIVEQARRLGMTIIGTTVGRRESDGTLRPLNQDELAAAEELLGAKIINIPLEAGFDMEPAANGLTPLDQLKGAKPDEWSTIRLDLNALEESRAAGTKRLRANLAAVAAELAKRVPAGANMLLVHTMAGGIPRARLFMPLLNRVFKGQGDKYLSSADFWGADLGKLCDWSFNEVTADSLAYLIDETASLRDQVASAGGKVSYAAYGYHGCEVLVNGAYKWQSYTPYLQGWAKMRLEDHAAAAWAKGIKATVYNCPEIQTNSSALFLGVEISLYPLLEALKKEGAGVAAEVTAACNKLLAEGATLEKMLERANDYLASPVMKPFDAISAWPHHSTNEQMEFMLTRSAELIAMNANPKEIVCSVLSGAVFRGVGKLMLDSSWEPQAPVWWLNHDIIAKRLAKD
ncbi:hypothetical protein OR1_02087 [Geobacter sp. OR-1]|uniref:enoyl ACP reductase FabMG family protein n=1 Tax=Geobacter sp. OR-1 TaxID=1266765 RepID=UPI0005426117|nr:hypothetical protein [Geobacter sp. OR-1]GAM09805.1 hypothetical protein OR1_02087 [Geobacter sp. OR-1]